MPATPRRSWLRRPWLPGALGWLVAAGLAALAGAAGPMTAPNARAQDSGPCQIQLGRTHPPQAFLGLPFDVDITVQADCAAAALPLHLAVVVDNSVYVGGPRLEGIRQGVRALAEGLDFQRSRAGLATYNAKVDILVPVGQDKAAFLAAIDGFYPRTGSDVAMAMRAGHQMLKNARGAGGQPPAGTQEVLLLVAGGPDEDDPEKVVAAAQAAKDEGILVVTVAAASGADFDMMQRSATSEAFFYTETIAGRFPSLFQQILRDLSQVKLTGAMLVDGLAAGIDYSWGSGIPAPRLRGRDLTWLYAIWPEAGLQVHYQAICNELGDRPSSAGATVELTFDRGEPYVYALPVSRIDCLPPPTATPEPSASPTASATPSASPTPLPTRPLEAIYLPALSRLACKGADHRADVILLLDTSSSMHEATGDGEIKLQLALNAAGSFIESLSFPGDRAALVTFSGRAELLHGLSDQRFSLLAALGNLFSHVRFGSRLDLGLGMAQDLLRARAPGRLPVVVLLTDGLTDPAPALRAAERARAAGLHLYAVGLGDGADAALLEALAGDPARFFPSGDGKDLDRIFRFIAEAPGCPGG